MRVILLNGILIKYCGVCFNEAWHERVQQGQRELVGARRTWRSWQARTWTVYWLLRRHLHKKSHLLPLWQRVPSPDSWHAHPERQAWLPGVGGLLFNALPLRTLLLCVGGGENGQVSASALPQWLIMRRIRSILTNVECLVTNVFRFIISDPSILYPLSICSCSVAFYFLDFSCWEMFFCKLLILFFLEIPLYATITIYKFRQAISNKSESDLEFTHTRLHIFPSYSGISTLLFTQDNKSILVCELQVLFFFFLHFMAPRQITSYYYNVLSSLEISQMSTKPQAQLIWPSFNRCFKMTWMSKNLQR